MSPLWSEDASKAIGEIARRNGFSEEAGRAMAEALAASAGSMAQFHHPDLGGMGQWSRGGMLMIGDMFNNALKGRVSGLAEDLAEAMGRGAIAARRPAQGESTAGFGTWWPEEFGSPSSTGAQNGRRYAVFPAARRLAVENDGRVTIYDTGDHRIGGASQQQGGSSTLSFSTDRGSVGIEQFAELGREAAAPTTLGQQRPLDEPPMRPAASSTAERQAPDQRPFEAPRQEAASLAGAQTPAPGQAEPADPIELIRKLAALKDAGILTDEEFSAKKIELLGRI